MKYRVTFPNDYTYTEVPNIDGFKMNKEFDDVVFGWWDNVYISVVKEDYKRFMEELDD